MNCEIHFHWLLRGAEHKNAKMELSVTSALFHYVHEYNIPASVWFALTRLLFCTARWEIFSWTSFERAQPAAAESNYLKQKEHRRSAAIKFSAAYIHCASKGHSSLLPPRRACALLWRFFVPLALSKQRRTCVCERVKRHGNFSLPPLYFSV
jgi:hypothetical protein